MIVDFQLLNDDHLTIGKAKLQLPIEDFAAAIIGLRATAVAYTQCRWLTYSIYWQENGPKECHGRIGIKPCPEDY